MFDEDQSTLIGGTVGVALQGHITRRTSLLLNPSYAVSGPVGTTAGPFLHMFGADFGLVVLVN